MDEQFNRDSITLDYSNRSMINRIEESKKPAFNVEVTFQGTEHNENSMYNINEEGAQNRREYFAHCAYEQLDYRKPDSSFNDDIYYSRELEPEPRSTQKNVSSFQNTLDPNIKEKQTSMQRTSDFISSQNCNLVTPSQLTAVEDRKISSAFDRRQQQSNEQKENIVRFSQILQKRASNFFTKLISDSSCQLQDSPNVVASKLLTPVAKRIAYQERYESSSQQLGVNLSENLLYRYESSGQKKNYLVIITFMKKFANQLLLKLAYKDHSLLNQNHLNILRDKSIIDYNSFASGLSQASQHIIPLKYDNQILQNKKHQLLLRNKGISQKNQKFNFVAFCFDLFYKGLQEINSRFVVISPNSIIITFIQAFVVGFIFFSIFIVSIQSCFLNYQGIYFSEIQYVYLSGISYSLIDMYIGFYQGFYEFGCVVKDRFPFWFDILKLLITLLLIAHICGCGFHYVGISAMHASFDQTFTARGGDNWIDFQGLTHSGWETRYIYSLYFSVITMVTVGYGDVFPVNVYEKIYAIGMALVSCGVFAYSVNSIGQIFSEIKLRSQSFQQKQYDLLNFMRVKNISKQTQIRILKYLEYLEDRSDQIITKGQELLIEYPPELREEVMKEHFIRLFNNIPILKNIFSQEFLLSLCIRFKEKRLGPGEMLVKKNQTLENLFIITKGIVEFVNFDGNEKLSLHQIKNIQNEQPIIDVRLFFTGLQADVSIQSKTVSQVAYISFQDFYELVKQFPNDFEVFCMMKDQFLNDQRQYTQCFICSQSGHSFVNCEQLHYHVDNQSFIQRKFKSINQERKQTMRLRSKKYHSLVYRPVTQSNLKLLRWTLVKQNVADYAFINPFAEAEVEENGKEFFKRCPKINYKNGNSNDNVFSSQGFKIPTLYISTEELTSESSSNITQTSIQSPTTNLTLFSEQKIKDREYSENSLQTFENKRIYRTQTLKRKTIEPDKDNPTVVVREIPLFGMRESSFNSRENQGENNIVRQESELQQKSSKNDSLQKLDTIDRLVDNFIPEQQRLQIYSKSHKKSSQGSDYKPQPTPQHDDNNSMYSFGGSSLKNKAELQKIQSMDHDSKYAEKVMTDLKQNIQLQVQSQLVQNPIYQLLSTFIKNQRLSQLVPQETIELTNNLQTDTKSISKKRNQSAESKNNMPNFKRIPSIDSQKVFVQDVRTIPTQCTKDIENQHIFGKLEFEFDRMQEYGKYYPKNNQTKVIRAYKKWKALDQHVILKSPKKIGKSSGKQRILELFKSSGQSPYHTPVQKSVPKLSHMQEISLN